MTRKRRLRQFKIPKIRFPFRIKRSHKKGPRRKVRKSLVFGVILLISLIFGVFYVPKMIDNGKLKDLGYSTQEITSIRELKLTKQIIKNGWYSDYLAVSIRDKSLKLEYKIRQSSAFSFLLFIISTA